MPRIDDLLTAHPLVVSAILDDHVVPLDRVGDPTGAALIADFRDALALGFRRVGSLQTPGAAATTIIDFPFPLGYGAKIRVEVFGDDPTGAGIGSGEIQAHAVNLAGTVVVSGTPFGSVGHYEGSMVTLTQPISLTHSTDHLLVQITGVAATVLNWRAVLTVSPYRTI